MTGFIIVIHTIICLLLITIILMQSGRGGGLTESFAAAESMFGAKTNIFLIRTTTVLATLFFITCLSLAFLSSRKDKSLMSRMVTQQNKTPTQSAPLVVTPPISVLTNSVTEPQ